ncbi:MAG: hypothetical protein VW238_05570 [Nitrosomonadales bacterium]|jgi:hypothetical protein
MKIKFKSLHTLVVLLFGIIFSATIFAKEFVGSWILADTNGEPFEILLEESGSASGTHGKDMKYGNWEEKDGKALIYWDTGWITVIDKEGDQYNKKAFKPGQPLTGKPSNTSSAKRK